jgi:hypothetical protein
MSFAAGGAGARSIDGVLIATFFGSAANALQEESSSNPIPAARVESTSTSEGAGAPRDLKLNEWRNYTRRQRSGWCDLRLMWPRRPFERMVSEMPAHANATGSSTTVRAGGVALVGGAVAFMAVFAYLAARFNYPDVLDGAAVSVLPALLATGSSGRMAWALYAFLPLIWIPAGVAAFHALRHTGEASMRVAMHFAALSAVSMMLGLMRWPSVHWELAKGYAAAPADQRALFESLFLGLNRYLGNYIGEFLGELSVSIFFLLSAAAMLRGASGFPRWVGYLGCLTAIAGLVGMFRNVSSGVAPVAEVNNYLLPIWMIVFGITLLRDSARPHTA